MKSMRWMIVGLMATWMACGTPTTEKPADISKEEAAEKDGTSDDGEDLCESFGWYGDGICDNFCPDADPDCDASNSATNNTNNTANNTATNNANNTNNTANNSTTNNANNTNNTNNTTVQCAADADCSPGEVCLDGVCEAGNPDNSCGGFAGLTCDDGYFCNWALEDICGAADALGTCEVIPMACTEQYDPVCGCDGMTYSNECFANASGVSAAALGECQTMCAQDSDCGRGESCVNGVCEPIMGFCNADSDCAANEVCIGGVCQPSVPACMQDADCAADETCVNGVCEPNMSTNNCGGLAGLQCAMGEWCNYPDNTVCGLADFFGTCETRPQVCPAVIDPVCGCDGVTYSNECLANSAGVDISYDMACPTTCQNNGDCPQGESCQAGICLPNISTTCGGIAGLTCRGNQWCDYPDNSMCGAADQLGTCKDRPNACIDVYDPVCGCDGMTYSNACNAHAAGVDVSYGGMCNP